MVENPNQKPKKDVSQNAEKRAPMGKGDAPDDMVEQPRQRRKTRILLLLASGFMICAACISAIFLALDSNTIQCFALRPDRRLALGIEQRYLSLEPSNPEVELRVAFHYGDLVPGSRFMLFHEHNASHTAAAKNYSDLDISAVMRISTYVNNGYSAKDRRAEWASTKGQTRDGWIVYPNCRDCLSEVLIPANSDSPYYLICPPSSDLFSQEQQSRFFCQVEDQFHSMEVMYWVPKSRLDMFPYFQRDVAALIERFLASGREHCSPQAR